MPLDIQANRHHLHGWSQGAIRTRWDYDSPDFMLDDMIAAGDQLFRACVDLFRSGDIVYVTDAANKRATMIINVIDSVRNTVAWDLDATHSEKIVIAPGQAYTIRQRGRSGFILLDKAGKVIVQGMASREEAERKLASLMEKAA
jgi:hypothetical protein